MLKDTDGAALDHLLDLIEASRQLSALLEATEADLVENSGQTGVAGGVRPGSERSGRT